MRIARPIRLALRLAVAPGLAALLFAAAGCSRSTVAPPPPLPPLSRVDLLPTGDSLGVGGTRLFVATAYDTLDAAVSGATFHWASTNPGVVSVTNNGNATAMGEGAALVIASAGGKADTARVFVYTQLGWYAQTSNTARNLNGVFFQPDGRTGFAVGALGTLLRTTDAGATWATMTSGTTNDLQSVWFSSSLAGWAAGDGGVLLKTTNGGSTWMRDVTVGASENLMCVRFADANHGWLVGSSGVVVRTANGGASWSRTHPTGVTLNGVAFADTSNGWVVGLNGNIFGTHDGGRSWYLVQPSVTGLTLEAVARRSNTLAWAVGSGGARLVTTANTDSMAWSAGTFGAANGMRGVVFVNDATGYAVGVNGGGVVFKTLDGGTNWLLQQSNSTQALNDVQFVDGLRGWAVGDAGRIVHTSRGGNL
jgi:photosystem II stability/assembly factor-like uncharacterized protein